MGNITSSWVLIPRITATSLWATKEFAQTPPPDVDFIGQISS
jgi:hypothetical protein